MVGFLCFLWATLAHVVVKTCVEYRRSSGWLEDLYDLGFVCNYLKNRALKMRFWGVCLD